MKKIELGGRDTERLYLKPLIFRFKDCVVNVVPTSFVCDMVELINRHKARYLLPTFLFKPYSKVLDFPCGSGYAFDLFKGFNIRYEGKDKDIYTIEYAKLIYKKYIYNNKFSFGDLCNPRLKSNNYDVIICVEGPEHIDRKYQKNLIKSFYNSLKPGGTLYITTPEAHISGKSKKNKYHLWELSRKDFIFLLSSYFKSIQILEHKTTTHTGDLTNWMYSFCKK